MLDRRKSDTPQLAVFLKPKLLLALAAVVVVGAGYVLWRAWVDAACPLEHDVYAATTEDLWLHPWPPDLKLRVGEWLFFCQVGEPTGQYDRMVFKPRDISHPAIRRPDPRNVIARPMTSMARLRLWLRELLYGRHEIIPTVWNRPD